LRDLWDPAVQIARQRIGRRAWLAHSADDLASYALEKLVGAMQRMQIDNPEGFISAVIRNRIIDLAISRDAEAERLVLAQDELPVQKMGGRASAPVEVRRRGGPVRGLSLEVIAREDREIVALRAAAIVAVMPTEDERRIIADRIYADPPMSITELARKHGKIPQVMANYLTRVIGSDEQPGGIEPVRTVLEALSVRTATAFVRILVGDDDTGGVSDPFAGAVSHLELCASRSPMLERDANEALARLRWMKNHLPSQRGLTNKVLRRLTLAACIYVIDVHDAVNDERNANGLKDDIAVLKAVSDALRAHARD
jgi:hypothetical protein